MLTSDEERYLLSIPETRTVSIVPYTEQLSQAIRDLVAMIRAKITDLPIQPMGASALGISGQGDIDIYILCPQEQISVVTPLLLPLFGPPHSVHPTFTEWQTVFQSYPVAIYLCDPRAAAMQRQIAVFERLQHDPHLLREYAELKEAYNGQSFRAYQRAKYEFYHRVLDAA